MVKKDDTTVLLETDSSMSQWRLDRDNEAVQDASTYTKFQMLISYVWCNKKKVFQVRENRYFGIKYVTTADLYGRKLSVSNS